MLYQVLYTAALDYAYSLYIIGGRSFLRGRANLRVMLAIKTYVLCVVRTFVQEENARKNTLWRQTSC